MEENEYEKVELNGFTIIYYTEKSFVLTGEKTKDIKEEIKGLGGKWNGSLKCGKGWIFSMKHEAKVKEFLKEK